MRIASLGGNQRWQLQHADGTAAEFLDAHALTDEQRRHIEDWAVEHGLVERRDVWMSAYWDDELDSE